MEFVKNYQNDRVKISIKELKMDLKYLSILTNTTELDKREQREIMDFLRIHYNNLQERKIFSKNLS